MSRVHSVQGLTRNEARAIPRTRARSFSDLGLHPLNRPTICGGGPSVFWRVFFTLARPHPRCRDFCYYRKWLPVRSQQRVVLNAGFFSPTAATLSASHSLF